MFQNESYVAMRRSPDSNSRKFIPSFRNVIRFIGPAVADESAVRGVAEGTWARIAAFKTAQPDKTRDWSGVTAALVQHPGIMRARVFRAVAEALDGVVRNMRGHAREGMRGPDRFADVLVMIEGATESQIIEVEADLASAIALRPDLTALDSARMQQLMRIAKGVTA